MRIIFLLILLGGLAAGVGYPWLTRNFSGDEIGRYLVYERGGSFRPVSVELQPSDAPVQVLVDMTSLDEATLQADRTALTMTVSSGGRTVLAETLSFVSMAPREVNPQLSERIHRDAAGVLEPVAAGAYQFTIGMGDIEEITVKSVQLILKRNAAAVDPRIQPIGFALTAIGFIGLVLAMRRRKARAKAVRTAEPPSPKWGRNGG